MTRTIPLLLLLVLGGLLVAGCPTGTLTLPGGDDDDTTGDDDDDDTGDDDTTAVEPASATALDWRLHPEFGALVYVSWEQSDDATARVEYSFDEGEWHATPTVDALAGANEQLVVGIPYGMDAEWQLVLDDGEAFAGETITTDPIPEDLPLATVEEADPAAWLTAGSYLLTSINQQNGGWVGGRYWTFILDRQARPVWARAAPGDDWTLFAQVSVSGDHILWDQATYWADWDDGAGSSVHRTYLDGEIEEIATPGLHHAFVELPDGTLVWGSQDHGGGEALVEKGPDDPVESVLWTCQGDWPGSGGQWGCESNGLFYVEDTDSFLYSFYTNSSVVEVDRVTGQSLWWAGTVDDGYEFVPPGMQFAWQHGISYTDSGTLLLSTEAGGAGYGTVLREYIVDHDAETLEAVWNFGAGIHAETNGDAWRLDNGNTLHVVGSASQIYEVDTSDTIVWHLDFNGSRLLGRGEFIDDLYALVSPQ